MKRYTDYIVEELIRILFTRDLLSSSNLQTCPYLWNSYLNDLQSLSYFSAKHYKALIKVSLKVVNGTPPQFHFTDDHDV